MRGRDHARKTHSLVLLRHSSFHDGYDDKDHTFLQMYSHHGIVLNCVALSVYHRRNHFASSGPDFIQKTHPRRDAFFCMMFCAYFIASSTATATATVAPTMGLLPMPRKPIISTCAGTEEEPANWASECIRPMVSVMP